DRDTASVFPEEQALAIRGPGKHAAHLRRDGLPGPPEQVGQPAFEVGGDATLHGRSRAGAGGQPLQTPLRTTASRGTFQKGRAAPGVPEPLERGARGLDERRSLSRNALELRKACGSERPGLKFLSSRVSFDNARWETGAVSIAALALKGPATG